MDDNNSDKTKTNVLTENTIETQRASTSNTKIPREIQRTYQDTLVEIEDLKELIAHLEKSIPKATKSRKKDLKGKLRKARHSIDNQVEQMEDLKHEYPSLGKETQSTVTSEDQPTDKSEQRQDDKVDTVQMTDETLLRKNHWPDDTSTVEETIPKCFIYVDSEDDELVQFELVNKPTKKKTTPYRACDVQRDSEPEVNPVYISGLERQPSLKVLEEALKDWKEYCRVRDQTDDSESHGINEYPRRDTKRQKNAEGQDRNDLPTHSSINVIGNFTNFQDFYRDRVGHTSSEDPQQRKQNSYNPQSLNKGFQRQIRSEGGTVQLWRHPF